MPLSRGGDGLSLTLDLLFVMEPGGTAREGAMTSFAAAAKSPYPSRRTRSPLSVPGWGSIGH